MTENEKVGEAKTIVYKDSEQLMMEEVEPLQFMLRNCERMLLEEIAAPLVTPKDVCQTYALTLKSSERSTVDWAKVNEAIITRWSRAVLDRIKRCAHNGACFDNPNLDHNLITRKQRTKSKRHDPLSDYKKKRKRRRCK